MKRNLLIGGCVSILFVYLALRDVSWPTFLETISRAALLPLIAAVLVTLAGVYLRAVRWRYMVAPIKKVATWRLFEVFMIGSMANNLLPLRLGEIVRAFLLGRTEQVSKSAALATVVYERIVDVFSALALLWLALVLTPAPPWLREGGLWLLVVNSACLVVMVLMVLFREKATRLGELAARPFGPGVAARARQVFDSFVTGLEVATDLRALAPIVAHSTLVTACSILAVYFCFWGLSLDQGLDASVTLTAIVSFAAMIPAAPGNVGPIQYACIVSLALYDVDKGPALAYSLVYHATQYLPVTLMGIGFLWRYQMGLLRLAADSRKHPDEDA